MTPFTEAGEFDGYEKLECAAFTFPVFIGEAIEACEASIAASAAVLDSMAQSLGRAEQWPAEALEALEAAPPTAFNVAPRLTDYEVTSGREIPGLCHPTSPDTPRGLLRVATDGERCNGRLCWIPGV